MQLKYGKELVYNSNRNTKGECCMGEITKDILMRLSMTDLDTLEDIAYRYGSGLKDNDQVGIYFFTHIATTIQEVKLMKRK